MSRTLTKVSHFYWVTCLFHVEILAPGKIYVHHFLFLSFQKKFSSEVQSKEIFLVHRYQICNFFYFWQTTFCPKIKWWKSICVSQHIFWSTFSQIRNSRFNGVDFSNFFEKDPKFSTSNMTIISLYIKVNVCIDRVRLNTSHKTLNVITSTF